MIRIKEPENCNVQSKNRRLKALSSRKPAIKPSAKHGSRGPKQPCRADIGPTNSNYGATPNGVPPMNEQTSMGCQGLSSPQTVVVVQQQGHQRIPGDTKGAEISAKNGKTTLQERECTSSHAEIHALRAERDALKGWLAETAAAERRRALEAVL